ncbi:hypothetical protein A0H81_01642 [Grifola frondosa]|uniref:Uncharacterized protein n=1 Tax=Grifola frondosa TaxID=5627 RepID=A0A1C7MLG6_GRIFR|nr:hypothetical protein A0H81_01642 [Grifola frondosa]
MMDRADVMAKAKESDASQKRVFLNSEDISSCTQWIHLQKKIEERAGQICSPIEGTYQLTTPLPYDELETRVKADKFNINEIATRVNPSAKLPTKWPSGTTETTVAVVMLALPPSAVLQTSLKRPQEVEYPVEPRKRSRVEEDHARIIEAIRRAPRPSEAAKPSFFANFQKGRQTNIKNGRPIDFVGAPISIYHPVFAHFLDQIADSNLIPPAEVLKETQNIITASAEFSMFKMPIGPSSPGDRSGNDGVIRVYCPLVDRIASSAILKYKTELGSGAADPVMQGASGFEKWQLDVGALSSSVEDPIIQRLTDSLWLGGTPDLPERVLSIARVFSALKTCLEELRVFYEDLQPPIDQRYLYPHFQSYNAGGRNVSLTYVDYIGSQDERIDCALFEAKTDAGDRVVVKTSSRSRTSLSCAKGGGLSVVVMDFIAGKTMFELPSYDISSDILEDVKNAVVEREMGKKGAMLVDLTGVERRSRTVPCDLKRHQTDRLARGRFDGVATEPLTWRNLHFVPSWQLLVTHSRSLDDESGTPLALRNED